MINKLFEKKSIRTAFLIVMILLASVSLLQGIRNACRDSQDFQWDAAKVFTLGINPYDESASMSPSGILDAYGYDEYYLQMEANQFPSLLCILIPFTLLPPLMARYVWIVCNIIFTGLIILLLRKTFLREMDSYWFSVLSLLMIAGTPYRNQIGVGQHTLFAFCFFLIAVYFAEYRRLDSGYDNKTDGSRIWINSVITMISLFICFFKYTLTAPLTLYFVYKKKYKEIIIPVIAHGILTIVSAAWLKDSFINMILKPLKVASAISADGGIDISAILRGSSLAYVFALVIMIMLLIVAVRLPEGYDSTLMALLTLWSLIVTYHRTYDFFVMIVVAGLFIELGGDSHKWDSLKEDSLKEDSLKEDKYKCVTEKTSAKAISNIQTFYIITMLAVFFVLRIFSESTPSKVFVGAMYYLLTFGITYIVVNIKQSNCTITHGQTR